MKACTRRYLSWRPSLVQVIAWGSLLSIAPFILGSPKIDNIKFSGVFLGMVHSFQELHPIAQYALVMFIFLIRGPHAVYTWWIVYGSASFKSNFTNHNYKKKFIHYPLVIVPTVWLLFFEIAYRYESTGFFLVLFISLIGPLYSYHIISQDYGILAMLVHQGRVRDEQRALLKKLFRGIIAYDAIFHTLPIIRFLWKWGAESAMILDGILIGSGCILLQKIYNCLHVTREIITENIRLAAIIYLIALAVDFISRLTVIFSIGNHELFYLIRVIRHVVTYSGLVVLYKLNDIKYEDHMRWVNDAGWWPKYVRGIAYVCGGILFSMAYAVLIIPKGGIQSIIPYKQISLDWNYINALSVSFIGSFALLHYYLDSFPWRLRNNGIRNNLEKTLLK